MKPIRAYMVIAALATPAGLAQDLDGNLTQDSAQLRSGALDCNHNGVLDSMDVLRPHFTSAIEHLNGVEQFQNSTWEMAALDFNQDGLQDLAVCTFYSTNWGRILLWRNEGGPGLVYHGQIEFPDARPTVIRAADLNGDARPDLIAADSSFNRVYVMRATGDGTFAAAVTLAGDTSNNGSTGVAVGDLDGDSDIDIACTSWGTNKVNIFKNNGTGTFGARTTFATEFQPRDVAIGDFTGDGLNDLAIANEYYSPVPASANGTVSLLRNTGNAVFVTHGTIAMPLGNAPYTYQARPQFVEFSDVDHDGDQDLITSSKLANTLAVHLNTGGAFALAQRFGGQPIEGNSRDVKLADLDGDSWDDIVWADPDMSRVAVYRNNHGVFEFVQSYGSSTYGGYYAALADFSGDGRVDIVTANDSVRTFSVLVNKGEFVFDAPIHLRPVEYPSYALFADFTSDGIPEYVTLVQNYLGTQYTLAMYRGVGGAKFDWNPLNTTISGSAYPYLGDFNADGKADMLLITTQTEVLLGNGDGTFASPVVTAFRPTPLRTAIADYNGDGFPDLGWIVPGHPGTFRVSLGLGNGAFGAFNSFPALAEDEAVAAGDVNGDGLPEFLAGFRQQLAPPPGGVLSIFPNLGDGAFGAREDRFIVGTPLSPAVAAIAVGDFDANGFADVAVSANGIKLYRGEEAGLATTWEGVSDIGASMLVATDLDLDGDTDLVGRAATGMLYYNPGNGVFGRPAFLHRYDGNGRTLTVADVNADLRPDVTVGPENSWGHFLWLNLPPASGDLNGNGIPDECEPGLACDGDVNCDLALDGFDIETQERAVGGDVVDYCKPDPDFNGDFALDGFDVEAVEVVVGGGPCP